MSHLAEEYAKSCGVRIGQPVLKPHYFPVLHDKYITIHNDKKVQAKEYDMWTDVIEILRPYLGDIKIIQIGASNENTIDGVDQHLPTSTLKQCSYIIQNSLGHVGIDSVPVHIASALDKPVVGIYSHTYANTCSPLWNKESKAITIESDRGGKKPSFSLHENPKTINFIKPETISQAVLDVLGIEKKITEETIFIGNHYKSHFYEVVPTKITNIVADNIDVRMDYAHNEEVLEYILQRNQAEVTTSKPINERLIRSKRIKKLIYKTDSLDEDFCKLLKESGVSTATVCTSKENLSTERFNNFDLLINYQDTESIIENNKKKVNLDDFKSIKIKSNKKVICGDKSYESYFDLNDRKNLDDFYLDLDFFRVYHNPHEQE